MDPFAPAIAVIVYLFRLNFAVTDRLEFMVTLQVGDVPEHAPDHPEKVELIAGVAVKVTTVPGLKIFPSGVLTTEPVPVPLLLTLSVYRPIPFCVAVKVCLPTVMVPLREERPELRETEKRTLPFPVPRLPEMIEIQVTRLEAVQVHPLWAVTEMVPVPPLESKDRLLGEMAVGQERPD